MAKKGIKRAQKIFHGHIRLELEKRKKIIREKFE